MTVRAPRALRSDDPRGRRGRAGRGGRPRRTAIAAAAPSRAGRPGEARAVAVSPRRSEPGPRRCWPGASAPARTASRGGVGCVANCAAQCSGDGVAFRDGGEPGGMHGQCATGGGGHPYRECPVESCGPQPGRHACADGWPGVTATRGVRPAGSRSVIGANVVVIHCVWSLLDSGWFEHSATWVTNRGESMSVTVGSRAPSVQLMIFTVD